MQCTVGLACLEFAAVLIRGVVSEQGSCLAMVIRACLLSQIGCHTQQCMVWAGLLGASETERRGHQRQARCCAGPQQYRGHASCPPPPGALHVLCCLRVFCSAAIIFPAMVLQKGAMFLIKAFKMEQHELAQRFYFRQPFHFWRPCWEPGTIDSKDHLPRA